MLSGVGPKNHLEELGIDVIKDLPVGQYLKDHQLVILPTGINKPISIIRDHIDSWWSQFKYDWFKTGPLSVTGLDVSAFLHLDNTQKGKSYPDIQMIFFNFLLSEDIGNIDERFWKGYLAEDPNMHGFSTDICLTHPYSTGSIKLRSADPFDYPIIDPQFFSDRRDIEQLIGGIRIWERLIETQTFKDLGVDINQLKVSFCTEFKFRTDEFWECFIRHVGLTEYHHSCTCRMGGDKDPLAVLDSKLRVKGISGLRVVDASAFHNVTSGNINSPTIMLAEKAADMISGKDTVQRYRMKK
jgi:choline dehydrogenase